MAYTGFFDKNTLKYNICCIKKFKKIKYNESLDVNKTKNAKRNISTSKTSDIRHWFGDNYGYWNSHWNVRP
jgi:hypothetical protein